MLAKKYSLTLIGFILILVLTQCRRDRVHSSVTVSSVQKRLNPADTFALNVAPEGAFDITPAKTNLTEIEKEKARASLKHFLDTLQTAHYITDDINAEYIRKEVDLLYELNSYDLFWLNLSGPRKEAGLMLNHLLLATSHGLTAGDYQVSKLLNMQQEVYKEKSNINLLQLIQLDIRLSVACITFAWHLHNGQIAPDIYPGRWVRSRVNSSVAPILYDHDIHKAFELLQPQHARYNGLLKALELYRSIDHNGGWPRMPENLNLRLNDSSAHVPLLRQRLMATRDLNIDPDEIAKDSLFDLPLESAVRRFQFRHGLTTDGIVGKGTVAALNVPVNDKIDKILINLERIRWLPAQHGERYIEVNLPEFKLYLYDAGKPAIEMRTITGKQKTATPVFDDQLEYLVFSPSWTIPKSILHKEILPAIERDPGYLSRMGYKLYTSWDQDATPVKADSVDADTLREKQVIRIVQPPGVTNALGHVKFMMPNKMNIYLHDTPVDYLFERAERDFSHGCIRLEFPELLAEQLLTEQGWELSDVLEAMDRDEPYYVNLSEPVPVYLLYRTAFVDSKGLVNFRKDIYDHDRRQLVQLREVGNEALAGL